MVHIFWAILGLAIGGLLGWYWASSRLRSDFLKQVEEAEKQGARAAELAKHRLSLQLQQKDGELSKLRSRLEEERHAALVTQSRLQADRTRLTEERAQLEKATVELTETVNALRRELRALHEQNFLEFEQFHNIAMSLKRGIDAYAQAVGAMESRLQAVTQRLKELQVPAAPPSPGKLQVQRAMEDRERHVPRGS